jgi:hypothetical protein
MEAPRCLLPDRIPAGFNGLLGRETPIPALAASAVRGRLDSNAPIRYARIDPIGLTLIVWALITLALVRIPAPSAPGHIESVAFRSITGILNSYHGYPAIGGIAN